MNYKKHKFKKDIDLDAKLVLAALRGMFEPVAMQIFRTPDEAFCRAEWLKHQSDSYISKVSDKVVEMENEK